MGNWCAGVSSLLVSRATNDLLFEGMGLLYPAIRWVL